MRSPFPILLPFVATLACATTGDDPGDGSTGDVGDVVDPDGAGADDDGAADPSPDDAPADRPWTPPLDSLVYVNTRATLYAIDPAVRPDLVPVGDFSGPCTSGSGFYDIALDEDGDLLGISAEGLYAVDRETAACTLVRAFPADAPHFFSLSWVKAADPASPDEESLFAASVEDGAWVRIDPAGTTLDELFVSVGYHDGARRWVSSGDIVSVQTGPAAYRTFATLKCASGYVDPGCESDWLAEIDPATGAATLIGATGYRQVFGLGFWGDRVYGFTNGGDYILVDVATGAGAPMTAPAGLRFWGAGTTTRPYVLL